MMPSNVHSDYRSEISRRNFVRAVGGATVSTVPLLSNSVLASPSPDSNAETAVRQFYDSLRDDQLSVICFPFDHKLRRKVNANWDVTDQKIGSDFYSDEQRELIRRIVRGVTSDDGHRRLLKQMDDDNGGIEQYHCAIFGEPKTGSFQWELTGRHLMLRADGNSVKNAAFGGPIIYGHGKEDTKQKRKFTTTIKKRKNEKVYLNYSNGIAAFGRVFTIGF